MTSAVSTPTGGLLGANLICLLSMLVWAAGLPAANLLIPVVPPLPLAAMRLLLGAAVLLPLWWIVDGGRVVRRAAWLRGIGIGGVCLGLGATLLIYAQSRTDAVTVAVTMALAPIIGMGLECLLDGRRVTWQLSAGLGLSLAGGLGAYAVAMGDLALGLGALAALGSVTAYTWGSRATVTAFPGLSAIGRTALTVTGAAIVTSLAALIHAGLGAPAPDWPAFGWPEFGALLIFGIGSIAISQLLWIIAVGRLGIGVSSLHSNATPFYVMLILFALGGDWNWAQAFFAAVVGLGVLIAQGIVFAPRVVAA